MKRRREVLVGLVGVTVPLAGCSGGNSDGNTTTPTQVPAESPPTATQAPTETRTATSTPTESETKRRTEAGSQTDATLEAPPLAMDASLSQQMGIVVKPSGYVSVPDGATTTEYVVRKSYDEVEQWYTDNIQAWTVTESYDLRDEYVEHNESAVYGYKRLQRGDSGAFVLYRGRQAAEMGAVTELVHVTGSASTIESVSVNPPVYDIFEREPPRFVTHTLVDVSEPTHISYFRSAYGHSYTNDFETCRSMKHYLSDETGGDGEDETQYVPTTGQITQVEKEDGPNDVRVAIRPDGYPAFKLEIFHVNPVSGIEPGAHVTAGEELGTFANDGYTVGEPAVNVHTPTGYTLVSFYEVMTDEAFQAYKDRGVSSRDDLVLSEEYRDNNPVECERDGHGTGDFIDNPYTSAGLSDENFVELS